LLEFPRFLQETFGLGDRRRFDFDFADLEPNAATESGFAPGSDNIAECRRYGDSDFDTGMHAAVFDSCRQKAQEPRAVERLALQNPRPPAQLPATTPQPDDKCSAA